MDNTPRPSQLKQLIEKGREQGQWLTYAQVNDHLPDDIVEPDQIEDIINMINDMGIKVFEEAPEDADSLILNDAASADTDDETAQQEAEAALAAVESELGRTTDPVRMYMREMGSVDLLTREGEISIAKRIEDGLNQVNLALARFPGTVSTLLEEVEAWKAGNLRLNELVSGFIDPTLLAEMDLISEDTMEAAVAEEAEYADDEVDDEEDDKPAPTVNTGPDPAQVTQYFDELERLQSQFLKLYDRYGPNGKKTNELKDQIRTVHALEAAAAHVRPPDRPDAVPCCHRPGYGTAHHGAVRGQGRYAPARVHPELPGKRVRP